jgi:peptidoglycan/LPS O-acetylase OafA/YrhL
MEIRKLNMLRGLAALIVLVSHYSNATNLLNAMPGRGAGQLGVMIFFILSGFLMSYLYLKKGFTKDEVK